jgi:hypothetical protein
MNYKKIIKYILVTLAIFFVLSVLTLYLFLHTFVNDTTEFFNKFTDTQKTSVYSKESVHGEIKISHETLYNVEVTLYDAQNHFIDENVTLLLNGTQLKFTKVPNGYYGYWKYYYISSHSHPKLFEQSDTFIFTLQKENATTDLASVKKSLTAEKEVTIPFSKELNPSNIFH